MNSNIANNIATVLGTILGVFFFLPGVLKLVGNNLPFWQWARESYSRVYPAWVYYVSGVIELVGGSGLLFPRLRLYGAALIAVLILGLAIYAKEKTTRRSVAMTLVSLVLLGLTMILAYLSEQ